MLNEKVKWAAFVDIVSINFTSPIKKSDKYNKQLFLIHSYYRRNQNTNDFAFPRYISLNNDLNLKGYKITFI